MSPPSSFRQTMMPRVSEPIPAARNAAATGPLGFVSVDCMSMTPYATGAALVIRAPNRPAIAAAAKASVKKTTIARRISPLRTSCAP